MTDAFDGVTGLTLQMIYAYIKKFQHFYIPAIYTIQIWTTLLMESSLEYLREKICHQIV